MIANRVTKQHRKCNVTKMQLATCGVGQVRFAHALPHNAQDSTSYIHTREMMLRSQCPGMSQNIGIMYNKVEKVIQKLNERH